MLDFVKQLVLGDKRKILSADKARKFSDDVNDKNKKIKEMEELEEIQYKIKEAIDRGRYSIPMYIIFPVNLQLLEESKYSVTKIESFSYTSDRYEISWLKKDGES